MARVFAGLDPLVVVEPARTLRDVEAELAERALVVLPAAVGLFEEVVGELLDRFGERERPGLDARAVPQGRGDLDVGRGQLGRGVADAGIDAFDLAGVARAVEGDNDGGDAGCGEGGEDGGLVGGVGLVGETGPACVLGFDRGPGRGRIVRGVTSVIGNLLMGRVRDGRSRPAR